MNTNAQQFEAAFRHWLNANPSQLPFGAEAEEVQLLAGRDRKDSRRRSRSADKPSRKGDCIFIQLRRVTSASAAPRPKKAAATLERAVREQAPERVEEAWIADLIRALHDAEKVPGHSFVALKWFRDSQLPRQGFDWAREPELRNRVLRAATGRGWVAVNKIANPRNPGFDTSVLRVQIGLADVQAILGQEASFGWGFKRIVLPGEPLSETVKRMRDDRF